MAARELKFSQAIREALDQCLATDPSVYLIGLGVPDPKGIFGSTVGLQQRHGAGRVMDMPTSENAMTGVAIGTALAGLRPILSHQRIDFTLLSMDQIVNQAAKWYYMFGGKMRVPLVIRMIIGRGWGQGPQHSQSLQAWFAHVPGLKVVMPTTPHDAKGLLIASIEDDNPVLFLEHRWLYDVRGPVPEASYRVPLGCAAILRPGVDVTIAAMSYMTLEALRAAELLAEAGVEAEVIDLRTLRPFDAQAVIASVRKTGRLLVADTGSTAVGFGAEVIARVCEEAFGALKRPPKRLGLPDCPCPSTPALANQYYPRATHLVAAVQELMDIAMPPRVPSEEAAWPLDVPNLSFAGPF